MSFAFRQVYFPALMLLAFSGTHASAAYGKTAADEDAAIAFVVLVTLFLILLLGIFFIPTIVAFAGEHPNRWLIFLVNLVFGATVLGWFGSLIWACNAAHRPREGVNGGESGLNLFVNDVQRVAIVHHVELPVEALGRLKALLDDGAIDPVEYQHLKSRLLRIS